MPNRIDWTLAGIAIFGVAALSIALLAPFDEPSKRGRWVFEVLGAEDYRIFSRTTMWLLAFGSAAAFWSRLRTVRRLRTFVQNRALLDNPPIVDQRIPKDAN